MVRFNGKGSTIDISSESLHSEDDHEHLSFNVGIVALSFGEGLAGVLFCRDAASGPSCETSTCMVMGSEESKYLRVVSLMTVSLTCWKVAS